MTDITPERMSEEELTELRGFACISYVAELFAHIDALTAENETLKVYNGRLEAALADPSAINAYIDRNRELTAENAELRQELGFRDESIVKLKAELKNACDCIEGHNEACRESLAERDTARAECERLEQAVLEEIDKRDAFEDALTATHLALGGDGEWTCRVPPQEPPNSGDLRLDCQALAAQQAATIAELRAECERLREWEWTKADQVAMARFCCLANRIIDGGAGLIASERERQKTGEGWTPEHDDQHANSELVEAAVCYLQFGSWVREQPPHDWPWDASWWKPFDTVRNLVKAGALIAAEIDRLQREAAARAALEGKTP